MEKVVVAGLSQGEMPRKLVMGLQTMGSMKPPEQAERRGTDELQRALEGELVHFLQQQNSQLMKENADLKAAAAATSHSPWRICGGWSWVV